MVFDSAFFILYEDEIHTTCIPLAAKIILPEKNGFCGDGLKSTFGLILHLIKGY